MARTTSQIITAIKADMATYPQLAPLLANTSQTSIWYLFIFTIASAIVILEQLMDAFKNDTDNKIATAAAATAPWLQQKVFQFQYSASNPQIVKLDTTTFAPTYDIINPDLQIVKKCSINTTVSNYVTIKVAKDNNGVLSPLDASETASLQGYVNTIGTAGINYIVTSSPANQLYWNVEITYDAQYASVIKQNIVDATNAYLLNIPFDGVFRVNKLEAYILNNVAGVIDLLTNQMSIREDYQTVDQGTALVVNGDLELNSINPTSGYIITETTGGYTLLDGNNILLKAY